MAIAGAVGYKLGQDAKKVAVLLDEESNPNYDALEKRKFGEDSKQKAREFKDSAISPNPQFDPDDDGEDKERKINCSKAESPIWKELQSYKNGIKTNGQSGSKMRFYEWDYLHNEIEVYGPKGREHLGAMDPKTGQMIKPPRAGRNIINKIN